MQPRERRLDSEHKGMVSLANSSSLIKFSTAGAPPTRYDITMKCMGMRKLEDKLYPTSDHRLEITLDDNFPLLPPIVVWRTPIFHPNIKPPYVCSGNIWYAAMSLAEFCVTLCEMVQYKSFNVYSTLNEEAAEWVWRLLAVEPGRVPVDPRPVIDLNFDLNVSEAPGQDGGGT